MLTWLPSTQNLIQQEVWLSDRLVDPALKIFFDKTLRAFTKELQLLADQWYNYSEDGKKGVDEVFALIERSYVGLFNNAVVKSFPNDSALQEFSVHLGGRNYVRGDYLVKHWEGDRSLSILFEAKQRQHDGRKYSMSETKAFLDPFIEQGKKYYIAETQYYQDETYISSLVFEWVRYPEHLKNVLSWSDDDDGITDFYCLYHTNTAGLMVYGNLTKVQ